MTNEIKRKIAIKDYYGKGEHIYEDQMGFDEKHKTQARSLVAREVFRYHVEEVGLNLAFYYPPTDTFYAIFIHPSTNTLGRKNIYYAIYSL